MAADETSDSQRDDAGGSRTDAGRRAPDPGEDSEALDEFSEDLKLVVEIVRDFAAFQSSEAAVVQKLISVVADLSAASAGFYESLTELHARVDLLARDRPATAATGRGAQIDEQLNGTTLALHEQAHQLQRHADELKRYAERLCGRAESLTQRASEVMRESRDIVAASGPRAARAAPRGRGDVPRRRGSR